MGRLLCAPAVAVAVKSAATHEIREKMRVEQMKIQ